MTNEIKLTPKIRFSEFKNSGEWKEDIAKNVFMTISEKNHPELNVLAATQEYGMLKRDDMNYKIQYNIENTNYYKKVSKGDFVIHLRSFQGGFAYSDIEGITSPAYIVFRIRNTKEHYPYFWKYIFSSVQFIQKLELITYGVRDGRSISFKDFAQFKLKYPPLKEQQKIAEFLSSIDELIELEKIKLAKLKEYKKGLLQDLFPKENQKVPDLRFSEFKNGGEWEEKNISEVLDYEQPTNYIVENNNYEKEGIPVLTANKGFVLGYTNETFGIYTNIPVIIFDDFTTNKKYVPFPFKIKSSAIKILSTKRGYNAKFIYELMTLINFNPQEHKRYYISTYQYIKILLSPLQEQQKIAEFLSSIDELIELEKIKLEKLKEYKKGLLQQILPNQI